MDRYSTYRHLSFDRHDGVLTVILNAPGPMNVTDAVLHAELATVFDTIRGDDLVDAVVLTGAGEAFSGGADLRWLVETTPTERDRVFVEARKIIIDLLELPQPIIAAIEGPAVGLGATMALFCDFKVAAADARIGDLHTRVGMVAGDGGAVIWPWLIGAGRAKWYLMTGDSLAAADAERLGLIDEVVPHGNALERARVLAARLAGGHRDAIRGTKASVNKLLRDAANLVLDTSLSLEKESLASETCRTSLRAALAKAYGSSS
jgi:enoyl-CoA hydratase